MCYACAASVSTVTKGAWVSSSEVLECRNPEVGQLDFKSEWLHFTLHGVRFASVSRQTPHAHARSPDVYSLSCKYYIEAISIINEHNHPASGGISFTASLRSIPYIPESKGKRRGESPVSDRMGVSTKNCAHCLPKGCLSEGLKFLF